jgi:putative acyl-CoA dehydrogenase
MSTASTRASGICDTHEVFNQSPPYVDVDLFRSDRPLRDAIAANGVRGDDAALSAFGKHWGSSRMAEAARLANENRPRLKAFDDKGFRRDVVEFHPAYHQFMADSIGAGMAAMTWTDKGTRAAAPAEVARAARYYMIAQVENGHMCPVTMTRAAIGALANEPALLARVMPKISSRKYDPHFIPWPDKTGVTIGMGMTEKQGGTDVRANTSEAVADGDGYRITGHKWFMSAPMCDMFLVLAQAPDGLTCFLMPRGGPRRSHHHRHGATDTARLRDCLRRHHARRADPRGISCAKSHGVPEKARRPAADGDRAGRSCAGVGGGLCCCDAAVPILRSCRNR